jgi:hypothetical protein
MARRHRVAIVVAALLAVSLAACDGSGGGPTTPPTVSFPSDPNKAPSVPDPIDNVPFVDKPCDSLTPEQQRKYSLAKGAVDAPGYEDPPRNDYTCYYPYTSGERWIRISYPKESLKGLFEVPRQSSTRWEPQVLDGFPAVATYSENDIGVPSYPPSCSYWVGVSDYEIFHVLAQDTDGSSECGLAKRVAADVLSNIKDNR